MASCLYEVVTGTEAGEVIRQRLAVDVDHAAPHVIDVEVLNVIRRHLMEGRLDPTAGEQAVEDLRDCPGERFGHQDLLARAWELRSDVRGWDAVYVALAEALGASLLTIDGRLGRVDGLACPVEVASASSS